jgi:hypothetical protein
MFRRPRPRARARRRARARATPAMKSSWEAQPLFLTDAIDQGSKAILGKSRQRSTEYAKVGMD